MSFLGQVSLGDGGGSGVSRDCGLRGFRWRSIGPTVVYCDDKFHLGHGESVVYQYSDAHETCTQAWRSGKSGARNKEHSGCGPWTHSPAVKTLLVSMLLDLPQMQAVRWCLWHAILPFLKIRNAKPEKITPAYLRARSFLQKTATFQFRALLRGNQEGVPKSVSRVACCNTR